MYLNFIKPDNFMASTSDLKSFPNRCNLKTFKIQSIINPALRDKMVHSLRIARGQEILMCILLYYAEQYIPQNRNFCLCWLFVLFHLSKR